MDTISANISARVYKDDEAESKGNYINELAEKLKKLKG